MTELKENTRYYATGYPRIRGTRFDLEKPFQGKSIIKVRKVISPTKFFGESNGGKSQFKLNKQGLWINQKGRFWAERLEEIK